MTSVKFTGMVRDRLARKWPDVQVESAVIDPVAFQPSDRDDELLMAQVYESVLGMKIRPAASASWDTGVEAMRQPFNGLVDGVPAILLDASMTVTAEALSSRVCFRETADALEKIVSDNVYKPHPSGRLGGRPRRQDRRIQRLPDRLAGNVSDEKQRQPRVGHQIKAADGRFYEFWIDEYQRRWWRCVEEPSKLVPYNAVEEPEARPPYEPPLDPWTRGLYKSDFFD